MELLTLVRAGCNKVVSGQSEQSRGLVSNSQPTTASQLRHAKSQRNLHMLIKHPWVTQIQIRKELLVGVDFTLLSIAIIETLVDLLINSVLARCECFNELFLQPRKHEPFEDSVRFHLVHRSSRLF